jgi:hypothetical protein
MLKELERDFRKYRREQRKKSFHPGSFQMWLVLEHGYSRSEAQDIMDGK